MKGMVRNMDVYEWLDNVKKLDELINAKTAESARLREIAHSISPGMSDVPSSNTGTVSQKMQNAVCALVDLEREIDSIIDRYVDYKREVISALEKLPVKEYGVLHRYFIRGMTMEAVAKDMGYADVRQCYNIKKNGLKLLSNFIVFQDKSVI